MTNFCFGKLLKIPENASARWSFPLINNAEYDYYFNFRQGDEVRHEKIKWYFQPMLDPY